MSDREKDLLRQIEELHELLKIYRKLTEDAMKAGAEYRSKYEKLRDKVRQRSDAMEY